MKSGQRSGVRIPVGERDFSLLQNVQTGSGVQKASYLKCIRVLPRGKNGRYVKLNTPSTEVKNEWSCTSIPLICLHGVDRESFTFYFL